MKNRGPTKTHALLKSSPAFDAGDNDEIDLINGLRMTTDQGAAPRRKAGTCDKGADNRETNFGPPALENSSADRTDVGHTLAMPRPRYESVT